MGVEFELKFLAEASDFELLKQESDAWTAYEMATTYYDTPDRRLRTLYWTLRRRFENGVSVCTLKTPAGDLGRNEFETECDGIMDAIPLLCAMGAPAELMTYAAAGIEEVCGARFRRLAGRVDLNGTEVELALDQGVLTGGGREQPFVEVEVELKSGSREIAMAYANALAHRFSLRQERKSKYKRALDLAMT